MGVVRYSAKALEARYKTKMFGSYSHYYNAGMISGHQNPAHHPAPPPQNHRTVPQWSQNPGFLNSEWLHNQQAGNSMHYATTNSTAAAMTSSHYQPLPHTPWTDLNIKLERIEDNLTSTTSSKNSS